MELGTLIDSLYNLRQQRLEATKTVDAMKAEEAKLREQIQLKLEETGLAKASGAIATAGLKRSIDPVVDDWDEFYRYIRENNRFDLLQRRISAPAWRELNEEGTVVYGTTGQEVWDLSLTKSTRG